MNSTSNLEDFRPHPPDTAGVLSWVHVGDLHMRAAGDQNDLDLQRIVREINDIFTASISFVLFPGDNADHGDATAYEVIRKTLDQLKVPWCAIVGDHDVEEKSFRNFQSSLAEKTYYAFTVGAVRFLAMNAFDVPEPPSFAVLAEQLEWVERQLQDATTSGETKVILLHCYPSDLKQGGGQLARLIETYNVRLVDMGHTHYNEISHNGKTIYTATRSTGQVEEGPVGFSVTNIDSGVVSWRFLETGTLPAVIITSPADERLLDDSLPHDSSASSLLRVRAKAWSSKPIAKAEARLAQTSPVPMHPCSGSQVWEATMPSDEVSPGVHSLKVLITDTDGSTATDEIQVLIRSERPLRTRAARDQDNALEAWPAHGLLGTQLGPNKNGRKW